MTKYIQKIKADWCSSSFKDKITWIILVIYCTFMICVCFCLINVMIYDLTYLKDTYNTGMEYYNSGQYLKAKQYFNINYKNSREMIERCNDKLTEIAVVKYCPECNSIISIEYPGQEIPEEEIS